MAVGMSRGYAESPAGVTVLLADAGGSPFGQHGVAVCSRPQEVEAGTLFLSTPVAHVSVHAGNQQLPSLLQCLRKDTQASAIEGPSWRGGQLGTPAHVLAGR